MTEPTYPGDPDVTDALVRDPIPARAAPPPVIWTRPRTSDGLRTGAATCLGIAAVVVFAVALSAMGG